VPPELHNLIGRKVTHAGIFGQTIQIITHFLSPDTKPNDVAPNPLPFGSATWQSSLDSSKVWAAVTYRHGPPRSHR
jgi:hypothetical protein